MPGIERELPRLYLREQATVRGYDHVITLMPDRSHKLVLQAIRDYHEHRELRVRDRAARTQPSESFAALVQEEEQLVARSETLLDALRHLRVLELAIAGEYEVAAAMHPDALTLFGQINSTEEQGHIDRLQEMIAEVEAGRLPAAGSTHPAVGKPTPPSTPSHLRQSARERALEEEIRQDSPGTPAKVRYNPRPQDGPESH
jgi:hypothetical protein